MKAETLAYRMGLVWMPHPLSAVPARLSFLSLLRTALLPSHSCCRMFYPCDPLLVTSPLVPSRSHSSPHSCLRTSFHETVAPRMKASTGRRARALTLLRGCGGEIRATHGSLVAEVNTDSATDPATDPGDPADPADPAEPADPADATEAADPKAAGLGLPLILPLTLPGLPIPLTLPGLPIPLILPGLPMPLILPGLPLPSVDSSAGREDEEGCRSTPWAPR
jgi:hypothetical protein